MSLPRSRHVWAVEALHLAPGDQPPVRRALTAHGTLTIFHQPLTPTDAAAVRRFGDEVKRAPAIGGFEVRQVLTGRVGRSTVIAVVSEPDGV